MGNYAQQADWLSCYHICYCTEPSAFWGGVTVPSGDSKSRWEYSHFPLSGLYLLLALSDHRSCLIMRQHLDDHRAISRHLWWPQGTRSRSAQLWSLQLRVGCSWTLDGLWPEPPVQCLDYCPSWPGSSFSTLFFFFFLFLWNLFPHSLQTFTICSQCVTGQVWCLCTKLMEASTKFSSFVTSEKLSTLTWPVSLLLSQMATLSLPSSFFSSCESCCPPRPRDATTKSSLLS